VVTEMALEKLCSGGLSPEYFEIVDGHSLESVQNFEDSDFIVACTAVKAGDVRLIDNIVLKGSISIPAN